MRNHHSFFRLFYIYSYRKGGRYTRMEVKKLQALLKHPPTYQMKEVSAWPKLRRDYIEERSAEYETLPLREGVAKMISEQNFRDWSQCYSCMERGIHIAEGDVCFLDFGDAFINEAGFQHFGVILKIFHGKAFVIPMSSNAATYAQAYQEETGCGKKHLMQIGLIPGLVKESVLFMNDAKFINTARIIEVKAHIDVNSELFLRIKTRLLHFLE